MPAEQGKRRIGIRGRPSSIFGSPVSKGPRASYSRGPDAPERGAQGRGTQGRTEAAPHDHPGRDATIAGRVRPTVRSGHRTVLDAGLANQRSTSASAWQGLYLVGVRGVT